MRRPAFSLLETVVALGIAVVVLGASVSARQHLVRNAQVTEQQTILVSLANSSMDTLRMARQGVPADFGSLFGAVAMDTPVAVVPYADTSTAGTGNLHIRFCVLPATGPCSSMRTGVTPAGGTWFLSGFNSERAEIVAVATSAAPGKFNVIDQATFTDEEYALMPNSSRLQAPSTANYSYYYRKITVTKRRETVVAGQSGNAIAPAYAYYDVNVAVWPYASNQAAGITRTAVFTDPSGTPFL